MSAPDDLIAGRYRLVRLVGSGGMGAVWEAQDERLRRPVAVKQLHGQHGLAPADAELANQRAMREARITARLHHRHAVPVFDVVQHEGRPCLIMQFLPSVTLASVLREGGPLQPDEAAKLGAQISSALAAAHAVGIVHRDVKPGNILITDDGNALISDFGISHALGDATLTATGLVHGTPAFLSPEVARGANSAFASDVFSLGSTLYAALEGAPPFGTDPNTIALLHRVASGEFPAPQHSGPLTPILLDMLAVDPEARPSMEAVATALNAVATGGSTVAPELLAPTMPMEPAAAETALLDPATAEAAPLPPSSPPTPSADDDEDLTPRRPAPVAAAAAAVAAPVAAAAAPSAASAAQGTAGASPGSAGASPGAAGASPGRPGPPSAVRPDQKSRRNPGPGIWVAVLVIAALAAGSIWWLSGRNDPVTTAQPSTSPTVVAPETPETSATTSTSSEPTPTPSSTPTPSATPTPTPTPSDDDDDDKPTAAELAEAITTYYSLVPDRRDEAWDRLTSSYQRSPSGGRQGYEAFWKPIGRVSISDVKGKPPNEAEAVITYVYRDGRTDRERTRFGLVEDDGILKINSSQVVG
ncbi:MAG TPA: serine/threonine-protein kinase [Propionibacteriaceae bacterium]|nr:serine/threonine-protein kinase [Propionibacteriaceae bacterium]